MSSPLTPEEQQVVAKFTDDQGRLHTLPSKRSKLLVVLDHVAQAFELGRTYPEAEVNEMLLRFHPDVAALRRYLVEAQLMDRRDNVYWRIGGTVDV